MLVAAVCRFMHQPHTGMKEQKQNRKNDDCDVAFMETHVPPLSPDFLQHLPPAPNPLHKLSFDDNARLPCITHDLCTETNALSPLALSCAEAERKTSDQQRSRAFELSEHAFSLFCHCFHVNTLCAKPSLKVSTYQLFLE